MKKPTETVVFTTSKNIKQVTVDEPKHRETEFHVIGDKLIQSVPLTYDKDAYSNNVIMTKEAFTQCYNAWIKKEEEKDCTEPGFYPGMNKDESLEEDVKAREKDNFIDYHSGYDKGYSEGLQMCHANYERGLQDAWTLAREVLFNENISRDILKDLGVDTFCGIIEKCSVFKVIPKLDEYRTRCKKERNHNNCDFDCSPECDRRSHHKFNELSIGDEVDNKHSRGVIIGFTDNCVKVLWSTTESNLYTISEALRMKTGRRFNQIVDILQSLEHKKEKDN